MAYCSASCDLKTMACESGFTCQPLSAGNTGVCITNVVTCQCDATAGTCDASCDCDPDCGTTTGSTPKSSGGGCNALGGGTLASLGGLLGLLWLRRRSR